MQPILTEGLHLEHCVFVAKLVLQAFDNLLFERGQLLFALIARSFAVHLEVGQMLSRSNQMQIDARRHRMYEEESDELEANHTGEKIEADWTPALQCESADVFHVLRQ